MINNQKNGFSIIEIIVSLTFFSIIASSIYLMSSFLVSSNKIISEDYISEIFYRSYMERLKTKKFSTNSFQDHVQSFNGKHIFNIEIKKTPNPNVFSINLMPEKKISNAFVTYRRKFWLLKNLKVSL